MNGELLEREAALADLCRMLAGVWFETRVLSFAKGLAVHSSCNVQRDVEKSDGARVTVPDTRG